MLSSTATRGPEGLRPSRAGSWTPRRRRRRARPRPASSTASASGSPRLPPTNVGRPVARIMSPTSVVVVDLPLVPVIAISVLDTNRDASSISPVIGHAGGARGRQLGDLGDARRQHDQLGAREGRRAGGRRARARPRLAASSSAGASAPASRLSVTVTRAPRAAHSCAAAIPERPRPTTSTRLPFSCKSRLSSHLQRGDEA